MSYLKKYLILLGLTLLVSACGQTYRVADLHGRWLHKTEREGLDFANSEVLCHYSLSPQRIELFRYTVDGANLTLVQFDSTDQDAEQVLPFSIDKETLRTEPKPGTFRNFDKTKPPDDANPWATLTGLWQADGSSGDFLVFTEWNTVFGRLRTKEGSSEPLWAKYSIKKRLTGERRIKLWGLHGQLNLSGSPNKIKIEKSRLKFQKQLFTKKSSAERLALQAPKASTQSPKPKAKKPKK